MKLNKAEQKWIAEMQALLDACPTKRIGFYTIGDAQIVLYDRSKENKINDLMDAHLSRLDFGNAVEKAGAAIDTTLDFPSDVHSVAG